MNKMKLPMKYELSHELKKVYKHKSVAMSRYYEKKSRDCLSDTDYLLELITKVIKDEVSLLGQCEKTPSSNCLNCEKYLI